MERLYTIETRKESLKFSAAHMATFEDGSIERLHGHNYRVSAKLSGVLDEAGMVVDVGLLRDWVKAVCDELDERFLVSLKNPRVAVDVQEDQVHLEYKGKRYAVAREDCVLLPIPNTTMEHLGWYIAERVAQEIKGKPFAERLRELEVAVSETQGQSASWRIPI
ncbi:MAG: 6-pyruvoyl trahydropterin synthase family protein [Candidatus Sumerlaeia bacterium]